MAENDIILRSLDLFKDAFPGRINQILKSKEEGRKIIGTLCLYVPDELIYACDADRLILCGGRSAPIEAEATCDGKKKMYELLDKYIPTHVMDLPQKPENQNALEYYIKELESLKDVLENLTGNKITDTQLRNEVNYPTLKGLGVPLHRLSIESP